jgi:hypothetical protein
MGLHSPLDFHQADIVGLHKRLVMMGFNLFQAVRALLQVRYLIGALNQVKYGSSL